LTKPRGAFILPGISSDQELEIHVSGENIMKKALLVCAAVMVLAGLISAPVAAATKFNFGVKAGVSLANNLWSDDDGTEKAIIRPTFGVFALVDLTPTLAIQPEINYLVMGEQWDVTDGNAIEEFTYLHIPILLRARLMREGQFVPIVFAGPAVGFLLSAKDSGDDVKQFFKSTDFGADLGLGAEMMLGKMKALIDLRYYLGLTNAYSNPVPVLTMATMDFSMKNRGFIFTVGLIF
jgi:hypothetical protein